MTRAYEEAEARKGIIPPSKPRIGFVQPFGSARLKLDRAAQHLEDLERAVTAFLDSRPVRVVIEQSEQWKAIGSYVWTARIDRSPPWSLSAMIGDAVHNLRTALDLVASDLARLNGQSAKGVYFPFAGGLDDLKGQIKLKRFDRAGPEAVRTLRALRPYKGGNELLRGLHDLDIQDKHKALIPAVAATSIPPMTLVMGGRHNPLPEWRSTVTTDGQMLLVMPAVGNLSVGDEMGADLSLVFGANQPFAGMALMEVLRALQDATTAAVDDFVKLYPDAVWPEPALNPDDHEGRKALIVGTP